MSYLPTAVELSLEKDKSPRWYLAIASGFVLLLVVVALCIHAPCECLWRRHRNEHFNCPIARSKGGMCGKCYVNNSATTTTLTYKENPHKVCVTMASNGSYHRPNSGEYTSQVNNKVALFYSGEADTCLPHQLYIFYFILKISSFFLLLVYTEF